ncbi:type I-C CRISPR-associated protein Cas5 [Tissierella creatinini]|nr:type I-C CRISPR-associated protein Cas5 [Tissierella creatinini]TJX64642.1 type I-C CRISPR-associated protein Cas5 [Soehngenia saccharolytica]
MKPRNSIEFKVSGKYALFSDPITRVGGEKYSYTVPSYSALKGIVESIYWKPSIIWIIDKVRIMNEIKTQSQGVKTLKYNDGKNDLSIYCYLANVSYNIQAHFEFNQYRPDLEQDWNENKHHNIAKRMVEKGGRRDVFLGTRECQGYIEPIEFNSGEGFYDNLNEFPLGTMLHGINYPDETGRNTLEVRFWQPIMKKGVIDFIRPENCTIIKAIREMNPKKFSIEDIRGVDEEIELLGVSEIWD